jgi:hypothetical protein
VAANTKQSIRRNGNIESSDYCFAGPYCDINRCMIEAGTAMLTEKFDAYGEVLPEARRGKRDAGRPVSAVLSRVGQYVFWLLVVVIVSARVMYYPASPRFEVGSASDVKQAIVR